MARGPRVKLTVARIERVPDPRPVGPLLNDAPGGVDPLSGASIVCSGVMKPHEGALGIHTVGSRYLRYYDPMRADEADA